MSPRTAGPRRTPRSTRVRSASTGGPGTADRRPGRWRPWSRKDRRATGAGEPFLLQLGQLAGIAELVDGLGHACGERAAPVQHDAELLSLLASGRQLADDDPVRQLSLHGEGCWQIQYQRIDLAVGQRGL